MTSVCEHPLTQLNIGTKQIVCLVCKKVYIPEKIYCYCITCDKYTCYLKTVIIEIKGGRVYDACNTCNSEVSPFWKKKEKDKWI